MRLRFRWKLFAGFFSLGLFVAGAVAIYLSFTRLESLREHQVFIAKAAVNSEAIDATDRLYAAQRRRYLLSVGFILTVAVAAALPTAFFIAHRLNRPIRLLELGMKHVAEGRLDARVPRLRTRDEFEPLIDQFNRMVDDLSDRRRLQDSLERHKRLEAFLVRERDQLFSLSLDLICVAGTDGYFKRVNPAFERVLGYPTEEILSRPFIEFVHVDDVHATLAEVERLASGNPTARFENRYRRKDGGYTHLEWAAAPMVDQGLIYAIARDITDRRRAARVQQELYAQNRQLVAAREIQQSLLPQATPVLPGYDVTGSSIQAHEVGGDYFDFIPVHDDRCIIIIGDGAGHGLGPALLMAQMRACLWSLFSFPRVPLPEIMRRANEVLHSATPDNRYVTLALVELEPSTGWIRTCNCGHPAAYVLDGSGVTKSRLDSDGMPLGLDLDCHAKEESQLWLEPGDVMVMLTDGIAEAQNPSGEFFGEGRALDVVRKHIGESSTAIVGAVQDAVRLFCEDRPADDDMSVVVLKALPRSAPA